MINLLMRSVFPGVKCYRKPAWSRTAFFIFPPLYEAYMLSLSKCKLLTNVLVWRVLKQGPFRPLISLTQDL